MDQLRKLIKKFTLSLLVGVVVLLLFNSILYSFYINTVVNNLFKPSIQTTLKETSAALKNENGIFQLSSYMQQTLSKGNIWAMLLDNRTGNILWKNNLPLEMPQSFTITDVAKFSRGYLKDYPVFVWEHPGGLLVLGYPKGSCAKQLSNATPIQVYRSAPIGLALMLVCDALLLFLLYYFAQSRTLKAIKPLVDGIDALAEGQTVSIAEKEPFIQLTEKVNQVSERLRKKETARANWISGVSHDIRTPLSVILGYAIKLKENTSLPEQARKQAAHIQFHGERISNLVNDLNLTSKLEYNMQPLHMRKIYVIRLLRQMTVDFLNRNLDDKYDIDCNVEGVPPDLSVVGDLSLLQRALENIISNSILHNSNGCHIWLSAKSLPNQVELIISDNGIGITDEQLKKLQTQPHYMMCDSSTHEQRHGLGLLIVKQIVQSHHGEISIGRSADDGFEIKIILPVKAM
ncbi:sensor histidine kinase [Clostridium drakei]|uniref:histidine kinase n=1 Tax=Clostridium drakei TaxID=332101 RepID=A0A2U8DL77_9CLOT|nr:HAMP domain-containing sensor histidine kinase [Clostridium drakei]AWI03423.1 two-component sensor histidine kinase [Clostridium drakei]